jgi:hypothetical protein
MNSAKVINIYFSDAFSFMKDISLFIIPLSNLHREYKLKPVLSIYLKLYIFQMELLKLKNFRRKTCLLIKIEVTNQ